MKRFACRCGQTVFFENSLCVNCGGELGYCPSCRRIVRLQSHGEGLYRCEEPSCMAWLRKCANYAVYGVCNRCVAADPGAGALSGEPSGPLPRGMCDCCELNQTIPDLSVPGNLEKWARLEAAKRRLMYGLALLGIEVGRPGNAIEPKLRFDFKADVLPTGGDWSDSDERERVFTGHLGGLITINIREADDVERERIRVNLGERYRTLLGHFRHEVSHYLWDLLVKGRDEAAFSRVFGDHALCDYETAKSAYYADGPPPDWPSRFVSAYAAMHPFEDWVETFTLYQEMFAALDTAAHCGLEPTAGYRERDLARMLDSYITLGTRLNEMNRAMGLHDWFVRVVPSVVHQKLSYIHHAVQRAPHLLPSGNAVTT